MIQQIEASNATKQRWDVLGGIDPSHIDTTYLPEVIIQIGKRSLVDLLNAKLNNPRFEVKFNFDKVKRTLMEEKFSDIALFYHDFTIPKPTRVLSTTEAIKEVFDVIQVTEGDTTITYTVYLDEGPYANTIEEIVYNINRVLGPRVETRAKQLIHNDYHMTFNISLAY
ncbi:hypothetical protein ACIQ4I_13875 [Rummeliibacillus sp. NPDC094406]|uniref:hypothetical protein n=1 Tax=Rummeliibacillus sp. NPDC094406 TaxID=3364511 RepID=UPI0038249030